MFFVVRSEGSQFILENMNGLECLKQTNSDVRERFPGKTGQDIVKRCRLAMQGKKNSEYFTIDLQHEGIYKVSLVHTDGAMAFFNGYKATDPMTEACKQCVAGCFGELRDKTADGIFIFNINDDMHFKLAYANSSCEMLAGVGSASCGCMVEDILEPEQAALMLLYLHKTADTSNPQAFTYKHGNRMLTVRLYPGLHNGRVVRVMGTASDITEYVEKHNELEAVNAQLEVLEHQLRSQLSAQQLISSIARDFMDNGQNGFSDCLFKLVSALGGVFEADYAAVYKCEDALSGASCQWAKEARLTTANLAKEAYIHANAHLRSGRMLVINDADKVSDFLTGIGVRALLAVPVMRGGDVWGTLCLAQFYGSRCWSTAEVSMVKIAAETIMSAYLRIKMEKQLCESNRILVDYDESLQELLAVEEIVAKISRSFITTDKAGFDACVNDMMVDIGDLFDIDAVCIYATKDNKDASCYQWSRRGIALWQYNNDTAADIADFGGYIKEMLVIDNIYDCPLPANVHDNLIRTGAKSLLAVPLCHNEKPRGTMFFYKIIGWHKWTAVQLNAAKVFSDIFLSAYDKNCWKPRLADHTLQEKIYSTMMLKAMLHAHRFVDAAADELSDCLACICDELSKHMGFGSVRLTRAFENSVSTHPLFEWHAKGTQVRRTTHSAGRKLSCIHILHDNAVWGCLYVDFCGSIAEMHADTLRLFVEFYARAYMRAHPAVQIVSCDKALDRNKLLTPQTVTV